MSSFRSLDELKPVLLDPAAKGPDPVYWVFNNVTKENKWWANMTVIAPGTIGVEYPKTFGHYHSSDQKETYHLVEGQGVLVLQQKYMEGGLWVQNKVSEFLVVEVKPGEEVIITKNYGHAWVNTGTVPLISFDDWTYGHTPDDYSVVEKYKGLAYYVVSNDGKVDLTPNPNYENLPTPKFITAKEFSSK